MSHPQEAREAYLRGYAWLWLKEYQKAKAAFDRALQLDPNYAEAYYQRGFVYFQLGNLGVLDYHDGVNKCVLDLSYALKLNPNVEDADKARRYLKVLKHWWNR